MRAEVEKAAFPALSATVASVTVPFLKVTVPVWICAAADVTVAVNFTSCPTFEGFGEEISTTVEGPFDALEFGRSGGCVDSRMGKIPAEHGRILREGQCAGEEDGKKTAQELDCARFDWFHGRSARRVN